MKAFVQLVAGVIGALVFQISSAQPVYLQMKASGHTIGYNDGVDHHYLDVTLTRVTPVMGSTNYIISHGERSLAPTPTWQSVYMLGVPTKIKIVQIWSGATVATLSIGPSETSSPTVRIHVPAGMQWNSGTVLQFADGTLAGAMHTSNSRWLTTYSGGRSSTVAVNCSGQTAVYGLAGDYLTTPQTSGAGPNSCTWYQGLFIPTHRVEPG